MQFPVLLQFLTRIFTVCHRPVQVSGWGASGHTNPPHELIFASNRRGAL